MTFCTPLLAALPELLKVIVSGAERQRRDAEGALAATARLIHTFWVSQRRYGSNHDGLLEQLAALSRAHASLPNQQLH